MNSKLLTLSLGFFTSAIWAKNCTESDIRSAASSGKSFDYISAGCTNSNGVINIKKGISVTKNNWTFDGRNKAKLLWTGGGKCDKASRGDEFAFFTINASKVTLRSFTAQGAPEGFHIHTGNGNVVDEVIFTEVCEKAIRNGNKSSQSATNTIVRNSEFHPNKGPADHIILVQGGSIRIEKTLFEGGNSAVAACAENPDPGYHDVVPCKVPSKITVVDSTIDGCRGYGMRSAGKGSAKGGYLISQNNTFKNCKNPLQIEEEGYVEAVGNRFSGCNQAILSKSSKAKGLYGCGNVSQCSKESSGSGIKKETSCK